MNILFLSELLYPHGSGAELATYLYARLLNENGFRVTIVTNRFPGEKEFYRDANLSIFRLPLLRESKSIKYEILKRFDILSSTFMRKAMKWADIVYVPRFWFMSIPIAKVFRKPVIVHLHDYISTCPLSNAYDMSNRNVCTRKNWPCPVSCVYAYELAQKRALKKAATSAVLNSTIGAFLGNLVRLGDAVICVSTVHRHNLISRAPYLSRKTYVVYNPLPRIANLPIKGDDFGYFGGSSYLKGFHILRYALADINKIGYAGIRVHATNFSSNSVRSLREIGLIMHDRLNNDAFDTFYEQLRGILVPSVWHEPWPYIVVEALMRGRFVIASNIGGMPEQLDRCKGAILCEPGNYKSLADAIKSVAELRREEIIDLGRSNTEVFLNRFNNETTIRKFISICEKIG